MRLDETIAFLWRIFLRVINLNSLVVDLVVWVV